MVNVIDNFLSYNDFKYIKEIILSDIFPWYFNDSIIGYHEKNKYQFTHTFFASGSQYGHFDIITPCLNKLNISFLHSAKANLNPKTVFHRNGGFHYDMKNVTTSILYINTNNGWTKFKNGCKVKCVENRMVIFDSNMIHGGISCTDEKRKVVVNFNYGTN